MKGGRRAHKQAIMRCPGDTVIEPRAGQHGAPRREGLARLGEGLGLGGCLLQVVRPKWGHKGFQTKRTA